MCVNHIIKGKTELPEHQFDTRFASEPSHAERTARRTVRACQKADWRVANPTRYLSSVWRLATRRLPIVLEITTTLGVSGDKMPGLAEM